MSRKELFIEEMERLINNGLVLSEEAKIYFDALCQTTDPETPKFTENGLKVLTYIRENKDAYNNMFKSKDVGEGMQISSRTVSGAFRKLVSDGYVEKVGTNPVVYMLTSVGETVDLTN